MPDNTAYADLKESIRRLEKEKAIKEQALKNEFKTTLENLNPFNFIRNSFASAAESSEVRNKLISFAIPLLAGIFSKKTTTGNRANSFLHQAGILVLDGLNRYVTQNPQFIHSIGHFFGSFFKKKKTADADGE